MSENANLYAIFRAVEDALSFFYNSTTYELISEGVADLHCRSDEYLAEELMFEYKEKENCK